MRATAAQPAPVPSTEPASVAQRSLPGGLPARDFLRDHWQKKPLLIRNAFPDFAEPLTVPEVLELAARDEAEARLVRHDADRWRLQYGPFKAAALRKLPPRDWTVLVQDTQHFSREARALLQAFDFIPHARIDDLMVSYAKPGGGVGAHFDSYDVFLLQGTGRRRWRISDQRDLALVDGLPLKILSRFEPQQEWVLERGDMLYLPPGYAHEGVALDECLTWSVGFRAPTHQELATAFLDHLRDKIALDGQLRDPDLREQPHPGEIPEGLRRDARDVLRRIAWDDAQLEAFIGEFLSEPKPNVFFDPPDAGPATPRKFGTLAAARGIELDLRTRLLFSAAGFFINGERTVAPPSAHAALCALADRRELAAPSVAALDPGTIALLHSWHLQGWLHLAGADVPAAAASQRRRP